jgi:hypothetical protein
VGAFDAGSLARAAAETRAAIARRDVVAWHEQLFRRPASPVVEDIAAALIRPGSAGACIVADAFAESMDVIGFCVEAWPVWRVMSNTRHRRAMILMPPAMFTGAADRCRAVLGSSVARMVWPSIRRRRRIDAPDEIAMQAGAAGKPSFIFGSTRGPLPGYDGAVSDVICVFAEDLGDDLAWLDSEILPLIRRPRAGRVIVVGVGEGGSVVRRARRRAGWSVFE